MQSQYKYQSKVTEHNLILKFIWKYTENQAKIGKEVEKRLTFLILKYIRKLGLSLLWKWHVNI